MVKKTDKPKEEDTNDIDMSPILSLAKEFIPKNSDTHNMCEIRVRGSPELILRLLNKD